jgi:hypothetical protein
MIRSRPAVLVALVVAALLAISGVAAAVARSGGAHRSGTAAMATRQAVNTASRSAVRTLPRLRHLTPPDALVTLARPITAEQLRRLHRVPGIRAVALADQGDVTIGTHRLRVLGLDVTARSFTPRFTAMSRPLWASVLRGELTVDFSQAGQMPRALGSTMSYRRGPSRGQIRIGAFASVGLGHVQAIADRRMSAALDLSPNRVVIVSAPHLEIATLRSGLRHALGSAAHVQIVRPTHVDQTVISAYARALIPPAYLQLYRAAASTCRGLPWTVLAAIGTVETHNGADVSTSSMGARGPMQFLPSTFAAYAVDGDGDGVANIMDPADAIYSAARLLCAWGAGLGGQSLYAAIFAYNHADWYVREVLAYAVAYA